MEFKFTPPYSINPSFQKSVAYFCMEYGISQPLKIYAGGLGFLAGSHFQSHLQDSCVIVSTFNTSVVAYIQAQGWTHSHSMCL